MKKFVFIAAILCFSAVTAFGQAKPYYTQYILNNYILNPGITGIENYTDVKLSYRNQWAGISGAPVTTTRSPLSWPLVCKPSHRFWPSRT